MSLKPGAGHFVPFGRMIDLRSEYVSTELFPLFNNRILPKSRPEYRNYLDWLGMDAANVDPLILLGRSGGLRGTDTLAMYPAPMREPDNTYRVTFFCHGMRYVGQPLMETIDKLGFQDKLYPMHDMQNVADKNALALRTDNPARMIGYCPRFFAKDFRILLAMRPKEACISVVRVNHDAPLDFRLLCEFKAPWPDGFDACEDAEYHPLAMKRRQRVVKKKKPAPARSKGKKKKGT